jgi:hypothetical protein
MTQITPAVWLDPSLSRAIARALQFQSQWNICQWETTKQFHEIMKFNPPIVAPDPEPPLLPGIFVEKSPMR